jgi:cytochrome d ubiquinol oxidase subunit II
VITHGIIDTAGGVLPLLSAAALAFGVLMYIVLDGADLGVGILFALNRDSAHREVMTDSILPVWDANETWIVLVAGGMLALFPAAFSVLLTALYLPLIVMLVSLILRGTALGLRGETEARYKRYWDATFCAGSIGAAFSQGMVAGAFMRGFSTTGDVYAAGWEDWFSAFPLCCGVALVLGYATLGAAWLIYRAEDWLRERARAQALLLGGLTVVALAGLATWTPFLNAAYARRWADWPAPLWIGAEIVLSLALACWFVWGIVRGKDIHPLAAVLSFFVLAFLAAGATVFPLIVPPAITTGAASAAPSGQLIVVISYAICVPIILIYNTVNFLIFRGKVHARAP